MTRKCITFLIQAIQASGLSDAVQCGVSDSVSVKVLIPILINVT